MPLDSTTNEEVPVHLVDLDPHSGEYNRVLDLFHKTMVKGKNYNCIVKIQRIQRPLLYSQYMEKKKDMKTPTLGRPKERRLFHGTSANVVESINHHSFDRGYAGTAVGAIYGRGCYFARDASYSVAYADPDPQGNCFMYVVQVLTGEFTQGSSDLLATPAIDPQKTHIVYDSVVDNPTDPTIFVVFNDTQAYPEYLIVFKK